MKYALKIYWNKNKETFTYLTEDGEKVRLFDDLKELEEIVANWNAGDMVEIVEYE